MSSSARVGFVSSGKGLRTAERPDHLARAPHQRLVEPDEGPGFSAVRCVGQCLVRVRVAFLSLMFCPLNTWT